ncbi:MAG: ribbon-helix-helix domain-containing protein [Candidatus Spechtbacterales bacterium]
MINRETLTISLPPKLLKETKRAAKQSGMTQSEFFRFAVRNYLAEDLEMYGSKTLRRDIKKARSEVKRGEFVTLEKLEAEAGLR